MAKGEFEDILETVNFIKDNMATKDDLEELASKEDLQQLRSELKQDIQDTRDELRSKVDGVHRRLDEELDTRKQLDVRVSRLEEKVR